MLKNNIRIKFFLFIIALLCSVIFFGVNWYLVNQFRSELHKQVKTIVDIYHNKLTNEEVDSEYLLNTLLPLINDLDIPMIITTKRTDGTYSYESINVNLKYPHIDEKKYSEIKNALYLMDHNNDPLTIIEVDGHPIIELHYGDSIIINNLRWISYMEFSFIFFIIILFVLSINLIYSNEKNYIYVGMAREAAHQLGTPISSLLGWLKLLETEKKNTDKIFSSMNRDVNKLKIISQKFNKIGSIPTLSKISLFEVSLDVIDYYKSKLPKTNNITIKFYCDYNDPFYVSGDKILLYWAIENIIKNAIDSIKSNNGLILLKFIEKNEFYYLDISNNGKTISRKHRNNIFKPGFSTKERGWGLGLNLSKRIINTIHKGNISLYRSNVSQTIFRIKLRSSIS